MKNNNLKIIHVAAGSRLFTQFKMPLIRRMKEKYNNMLLYFPKDEQTKLLVEEKYEIHHAPITNYPGLRTIVEIIRLYFYLRKNRFDVLIAHQPTPFLVGITAASLGRVPFKIYATGGLKYLPDRKGLFNLLIKYIELKLIQLTDGVLTINREDEKLLKNISSIKEKVFYVGPRDGCGVDTKRYNMKQRLRFREKAREEMHFNEKDFVIGYVGRCVWEKGFRELVDAAVLLSEEGHDRKLLFAVIGDGPQYFEIKEYIERKGVSSCFKFIGYKTDIEYYMSAFDIFVLPSYREGLPVSLLEAMALGVPSIGTNVRGTRELIMDGKTGLLVPVKNAHALSKAIASLLIEDGKRDYLGREGSKSVCSQFEANIMLNRTMDILERLVSKGIENEQ